MEPSTTDRKDDNPPYAADFALSASEGGRHDLDPARLSFIPHAKPTYDYGSHYAAARAASHRPPESGDNVKVHRIEQTIDIDCPVRTCYDQWTQFEEFPRFMDGVEQVEQIDDTHMHWVANIAGKRREWDAEIIEQEPDRIISWRSTSGTMNNGSVEFSPHENGCRMRFIMTYGLEDWTEKLGDALGILSSRVKGDVRRFKEFIEERQVQTGGWRGEVHAGRKREKPSRTHGNAPRFMDNKEPGRLK